MSNLSANKKGVSFDTLTDSCVGRLVERICDSGKAGDRFKYYNHDVRVDGKGDSSITVTVDGILLYAQPLGKRSDFGTAGVFLHHKESVQVRLRAEHTVR